MDRAISPYDYIRSGKTSKEVSCSIGSGAAFDEGGHSEVWGSTGALIGFPEMSRRIARRVSSTPLLPMGFYILTSIIPLFCLTKIPFCSYDAILHNPTMCRELPLG